MKNSSSLNMKTARAVPCPTLAILPAAASFSRSADNCASLDKSDVQHRGFNRPKRRLHLFPVVSVFDTLLYMLMMLLTSDASKGFSVSLKTAAV